MFTTIPLTVTPSAAPDPVRSEITGLLERRAAAVLDGDRVAFMGTVDAGQSELEARQRRLFAALRTLTFDSYVLEARWDRYGDLATLAAGRYSSGEEIALPLVEERYVVAGSDEEVLEELFYTFRRGANGEWLIAGDDDLDDFGFQSARHLWDFGPITVEDEGRFVVLSHPCRAACTTQEAVGSLADEALERVRTYWPVSDARVSVLIPRSEEELARMLQANFDLDGFVAFAVSSVDTTEGYEFVGPRIMINPPAIAGRSRGDVLMILAHELLHVATREAAGAFVPVFVEEGFANFVGHDGLDAARAAAASLRSSGSFDGRLPGDYEFMSEGPDAIFRAYQEGHTAVGYFIERHGLRDFTRFYRRLGRSDFRAGTTRYHVDRSLRAVTGAGFRRFEREWASSIAAS